VVACRGGAGVVLYRSSIGGHEWPGRPAPPAVGLALAPVDRSLDADEVIWHFFNTHPLPADPPVRVG
jgi:poly(3-hydroxybutyrate) depolymerase